MMSEYRDMLLLLYSVHLHICDHLGSVRAVVDGMNGEVLERNDYYPSGKRWESSSPSLSSNRWRYNGNEEQCFAGVPYIDYGARMYSPDLCRWTSPDPLSEKYYGLSPYSFCGGDPVNYIDPDGKKIYFAPGSSEQFKKQFAATIQFMNSKGTAGDIAKLHASDKIYYIAEAKSIGDNRFSPSSMTIYWDASHIMETNTGIWLSPATILAHEADHAQRHDASKGNKMLEALLRSDKAKNSDPQYGTIEEKRVITGTEQSAARKHGEIDDGQITRTSHDKGKIPNVKNVMGIDPVIISEGVYIHNLSKRL